MERITTFTTSHNRMYKILEVKGKSSKENDILIWCKDPFIQIRVRASTYKRVVNGLGISMHPIDRKAQAIIEYISIITKKEGDFHE